MEKVTEFRLSHEVNMFAALQQFGSSFKHLSILHSNEYKDTYGKYEFLAAFGAYRIIEPKAEPFQTLRQLIEEEATWLFGHLNYDLKNFIEDLESKHDAKSGFAELSFFEPAYLILQRKDSDFIELFCNYEVDNSPLLAWQKATQEASFFVPPQTLPKLKPKMTKEEYLNSVNRLKSEIQYGNIYELNYCQEFYAEEVDVEPQALAFHLNRISPTPFGAFYKRGESYLMAASPERYLCKHGKKLYSQPIKGTSKRGKDAAEDKSLKEQLKSDLKEQTENVMIVDLVRNDLSRTAAINSVKVEELFGVYTFPQVHQLISTVSSELADNVHWLESIEKSFPMGSMTGAPKISAMKLIEETEKSRRELYSGSVGYIDPYGDFDFNVVIRSLLYNAKTKYLSLSVGGAITDKSDALQEYEECLLKAKAIFELEDSEA